MDVLSERQHRALAFIASANRGGCPPTAEELELWLANPSPERIGGVDVRVLARVVTSAMEGRSEGAAQHLVRLLWVHNDEGRLSLTELGNALLRDAEMETTSVQTVILEAGDPLAYAQLVGELAGMGKGMIVDPYLDLQGLTDLLTRTSFNRILVSDKDGRKLAALGTYLQDLRDVPEVRYASSGMHDRVILAEDKTVWTIGASLNTVRKQKSSTILMPVPSEGVEGMRGAYEEMWEAAKPLVEVAGAEGEDVSGAAAAEPSEREETT
ncbi:hypothetical protein [Gephyromycinifex aptenodytis]|uniref:hypothetical protein n=1 Tax=Gephyromycinifex aptenodytis TaxID=2716227 RepID=UPI001446B0C0|nr:hypothetical protein [Gephyromycinifex aptenodytis]